MKHILQIPNLLGPERKHDILFTTAIYFRSGDSSEKQIPLESHIWLGKFALSNMD